MKDKGLTDVTAIGDSTYDSKRCRRAPHQPKGEATLQAVFLNSIIAPAIC